MCYQNGSRHTILSFPIFVPGLCAPHIDVLLHVPVIRIKAFLLLFFLSERLLSKLVNLRQLDGEIVRDEEEGEDDKEANKKLPTNDPAPLGKSLNTLI